MGPVVVVEGAEGVEYWSWSAASRGSWGLAGQEALEGLVEALNLAAGLGVIGSGDLGEDAEAFQLGFEEHLATA